MSFSFRFLGRAGAVKKAIAAFAETQSGVTKAEIVKAGEIIGATLDENVESATNPQTYEVQAAGHSWTENGEKKQGSLQISVQPTNGSIVVE